MDADLEAIVKPAKAGGAITGFDGRQAPDTADQFIASNGRASIHEKLRSAV